MTNVHSHIHVHVLIFLVPYLMHSYIWLMYIVIYNVHALIFLVPYLMHSYMYIWLMYIVIYNVHVLIFLVPYLMHSLETNFCVFYMYYFPSHWLTFHLSILLGDSIYNNTPNYQYTSMTSLYIIHLLTNTMSIHLTYMYTCTSYTILFNDFLWSSNLTNSQNVM